MSALDGHAIFGGIIFVLVILLVIYPISIRLPLFVSSKIRFLLALIRLIDQENPLCAEDIQLDVWPGSTIHGSKYAMKKPICFPLNLSSVPLLGVLVLRTTNSIGWADVARGIMGTQGVRPYNVLVLFISLSYIATALDATGGLRYLAFRVISKASSGSQLYLYLYIFFFFCGAVMGNDPIVLSGTPFLAYLTRVSGITPPTAWIFAQFLAANVSSAILVSSNPTNILIAGAFDLNFLSGFTKYTTLPSVVSAIVAYPMLYFTFRSHKLSRILDKTTEGHLIPKTFIKPDVDPNSALVDAKGAVFHASLLLLTLAVLVGTSFVDNVQVWMITAPAAAVSICRDVLYDLAWKRRQKAMTGPDKMEKQINGVAPARLLNARHRSVHGRKRISLTCMWGNLCKTLPSTTHTLTRLPWPLLPFAIGMFILVRSLDRLGYIPIFAKWAARACNTPVRAVFFVGAVTAVGLCPLCGTNIGATIFAVEVLSDANFQNAPHIQADPRILRGAIYAVALASNSGALTSLPSSLAGLLWSRILLQKGIRITPAAFSITNIIPVCVVTFTALGIICIEMLYWT